MDPTTNSEEASDPPGVPRSPEHGSRSVDDLPSVSDLPTLGLVGPGQFAEPGVVEAVREAGFGVCRRTGVLVCLVGTSRLAVRPCEIRHDSAKPLGVGLAKKIARLTGKQGMRKIVQDAAVQALGIASRLPAEVMIEQRALVLSETGPAGCGSEAAEVAPLAWAEPADLRFACGICPSTTQNKRKTILKHARDHHAGVPVSEVISGQSRPLQAVFSGTNPGYVKVKAAEDPVQSMPLMHELTAEQCEIVAGLTIASNAECSAEGLRSRNDENDEGTGFLFRAGISKAIKKLGLGPDTAYAAAVATSSKYEGDGVSLSPMPFFEEAIVAACKQSFTKFKEAHADLKAACTWKAQGVAADAAAEAGRAKAGVSAETESRYTNFVKRLVTFVARMIVNTGEGLVAPEAVGRWWREEHATIFAAVLALFLKCQEHSLAMNVSGIDPAVFGEPPVELMTLAHKALFELLVRPIPIARNTNSVSPVFAFLAASAAQDKDGFRRASDSGSAGYEWSDRSSRVTPLTAAIIKMATAVSVYHVTAPDLSQAERDERVIQVRQFRQEPQSLAATAPVAAASVVLQTGRVVLPAEHSGAKVLPCPNPAHPRCAFMGGVEVGIDCIGQVAGVARDMFWESFRDMFDASKCAALPEGLNEEWLAVPASGHDDLGKVYDPWMTTMGPEQKEHARNAREWVSGWAVKDLDVAAAAAAEGGGDTYEARNKKAVARVRSGLTGCARALSVMITLGSGAPLRATETSSINLRGGGAGVVRDLYFHDGAFFIIHHRTKASHNVATSGEAQPRRLPASASAALAAWCRVGLPLRDMLLHCGESIFGYSQTPSSPGAAASIQGLFWASNSPATSCSRRVNDGLTACGLPLTISQYRQYAAYMLRVVTREDGGAHEDGEDAGVAILAAAAERQFGHTERTGALFYARDCPLTEFAKKLPSYGIVSRMWHTATGQESAVLGADVEPVVQQGSSAYAAAGPAAATFRPILPFKRRAGDGLAGGELHATEPGGRVSVRRGPQPLLARSLAAPAVVVPQFAPLFSPSSLLLRTTAASVAGVMYPDFEWATKEQGLAAEYVAEGMPAGDALLVLPTGGGKFLTYAASCVIDDARLTVVIVPFVALAQDLHRRFVACGVNAARFGDLGTAELSAGCPGVQVVIAGLESVVADNWSRLFNGALARGRRTFIVVEECHVLYFDRYRESCGPFPAAVRGFAAGIAAASWRHNVPPLLLVTATAPPKTAAHIVSACGSDVQSAPTQFRTPCTIRPNVRLTVSTASPGLSLGGADLKSWITQQVFYTLDRRGASQEQGSAGVAAPSRYVLLVFVETRAMTDVVAACLEGTFGDVLSYHAKLSDAQKMAVFDRLAQRPGSRGAAAVEAAPLGDDASALMSNVTAVVATVGFGVGLDIPDVCTVCIVGHRTASSLITYAQMAGRAGRDGQPSLCATLVHAGAPSTSFSAFRAGGSGSRGSPDGALPNNGGGLTGDFGTYCVNEHSCRQGALHKFMDGASMSVGDVSYVRGGFGFVPNCDTLRDRFFPGQAFERCDLCAPESSAHAAEDGYDSLDDEPADLGSDMITQDYIDPRVTAALPPYAAGPSGTPALAADVEMPPLPPLADLAAGADDFMAVLAASYSDMTPPFGEDARSTPETAAETLPCLPQVGQVGPGPARSLHVRRIHTAVAGPVVKATTPAATTFADIPAAIAASAGNLRDFVRKVKDDAETMRDMFPRQGSHPGAPAACVTCLSVLVQGAIASTASTPAAQAATAAGGSGLTGRGQCNHPRRGCLNCTQNFSDLGARTEFDEHNYKSPQCPLAEERNVKTWRCTSCWLVLDGLGNTHRWGEKCPFVAFRDAAFRMWWEKRDLVTVFVAREQARRGAVSQEESAGISRSILQFARFLTRDHPDHGPPLLHLIAAAYAFL